MWTRNDIFTKNQNFYGVNRVLAVSTDSYLTSYVIPITV